MELLMSFLFFKSLFYLEILYFELIHTIYVYVFCAVKCLYILRSIFKNREVFILITQACNMVQNRKIICNLRKEKRKLVASCG